MNSITAVSDVSVIRRPRLRALDYVFILLMFTVNLQEVLEFLGEDSILKPYRVIALFLGVAALPRLHAQWRFLYPFILPLAFAYGYALVMTYFWGRLTAVVSVIPLVSCSFALLISSCSVSSKRSLYFGCYAYLAGLVASIVLGFLQGGAAGRFAGMFANPNYFGYACCIAIIFLMAPSLKLSNTFRVPLILTLFAFVFLTGSRSSLVSTMVAFSSQVIRNPRLLITMMMAAIAIVVASLLWESGVSDFSRANRGVVRRFSEDEIERGGKGRIEIATAALTVGAEHRFVGIGIDQFRRTHFTRFFRIITRSGRLKQMGIHNAYVTVLSEWGALAFIATGLALFRTYRAASQVPEFRLWIHGFMWSTLVIGLAGHVLGTPHFWLIYGFCLQALRLSDRRPPVSIAFRSAQNPYSPAVLRG